MSAADSHLSDNGARNIEVWHQLDNFQRQMGLHIDTIVGNVNILTAPPANAT